MSEMHGGKHVARALKEQGVTHLFTLCGGHIMPIYEGCIDEGIRVIDVRHEQAAVMAADAVSRLTRNPGVAAVTAGPGVMNGITGVANHAEDGARRAAELALAQPGAAETARRAKDTFAEFDRRMKEWGVHAPPDKLRSSFAPAIERLARPHMLPGFFAGLADGTLLLDKPRAVDDLFEADTDLDLSDLLAEGAVDGFDEPGTVIWVEPDLSWTQAQAKDGHVAFTRTFGGARRSSVVTVDDAVTDWSEPASAVLSSYLTRLLARDHAEGAAAWIVDASGYQATLPAAYARVLGESALQVVLRAGLLAAEEKADEITPELARRGVMAYETAFHSLPTLGAIL